MPSGQEKKIIEQPNCTCQSQSFFSSIHYSVLDYGNLLYFVQNLDTDVFFYSAVIVFMHQWLILNRV